MHCDIHYLWVFGLLSIGVAEVIRLLKLAFLHLMLLYLLPEGRSEK